MGATSALALLLAAAAAASKEEDDTEESGDKAHRCPCRRIVRRSRLPLGRLDLDRRVCKLGHLPRGSCRRHHKLEAGGHHGRCLTAPAAPAWLLVYRMAPSSCGSLRSSDGGEFVRHPALQRRRRVRVAPRAPATATSREARAASTVVRRRRGEKKRRDENETGIALGLGYAAAGVLCKTVRIFLPKR
jgi:hypothetical protein